MSDTLCHLYPFILIDKLKMNWVSFISSTHNRLNDHVQKCLTTESLWARTEVNEGALQSFSLVLHEKHTHYVENED